MTAIDTKHEQLCGERGFLGIPLDSESSTPCGSRYRHFSNGSIHWHPDTGAYETHGAIRAKWAELGWERSELGFPVSDEHELTDIDLEGLRGELISPVHPGRIAQVIGRCSHFQNGTICYVHEKGMYGPPTGRIMIFIRKGVPNPSLRKRSN